MLTVANLDTTTNMIDYIFLTGNVDYISGPYSVTFPAGASNTSFSLSITDDNITENTEAFLLNINPISLSTNLVFGSHGGAVVTIVDDDCKSAMIFYMCVVFIVIG